MTRRKMVSPTSSDGFRIRELVCTAWLLRHYHPQLFEPAVLDNLMNLYGDYAGASDYYQDLAHEDEPGPDEIRRRLDMLMDADVALDFAVADVAGSQVWGAFRWVDGPEWLLGNGP